MKHTSSGIAVFDYRLGIGGDLEVKATGTNSLMQKEVRSQRLTMFLQTASNPAVAPFIKMNKLISELAYSLDLDPDELMNDPDEAAMMAQIIGMQNNVGQAIGAEAGPGARTGSYGSRSRVPEQPRTWSYRYWWGQHRNRKCSAVRGR